MWSVSWVLYLKLPSGPSRAILYSAEVPTQPKGPCSINRFTTTSLPFLAIRFINEPLLRACWRYCDSHSLSLKQWMLEGRLSLARSHRFLSHGQVIWKERSLKPDKNNWLGYCDTYLELKDEEMLYKRDNHWSYRFASLMCAKDKDEKS